MAMLIYFILAILSPFVYAFMNILDKYVVSHKVRFTYGFVFYAGLANAVYGLILALFLGWNYSFVQLIIPSVSGVIMGLSAFAYYRLLEKEDASHIIGLVYVYPIIVAILSYAFLGEKFPVLSYVGLALIILGGLLISLRMSNIRSKKGILILASMVVFTGVYEFLVKVSTNSLPELNGLSLSLFFFGLSMMAVVFSKKAREGIKPEFKNLKWALFNEAFTFLAVLTLFLAMKGLPATLVSSVAALQPLAVLFYEGITQRYLGNMRKDHRVLLKFLFIALVVIGLIIIYLEEISALLAF